MKREFMVFCAAALFCAVLSGCGSPPPAAGNTAAGMDLDAAIKEAAAQMEVKIPQDTMVALVSLASPSARLSEYVIDRLEAALVSGGKLMVVDRANLDKIRAEQGFQMSGEVNDESAKNIGKLLGAGAIVTGAFTNLGDVYGLTLKAINMETALVAVSYPADIARSTRIETLFASGEEAGGAVAASGGQAAAKPAAPAGPKNGTYTFYPRLQPYKGASIETDIYLCKITVRGEFMNIYFTSNAEGSMDEYLSGKSYWVDGSYTHAPRLIVLQSLDNPALSYNPEPAFLGAANYERVHGGRWYTFKGVKTTRFSLTNNDGEIPSVFEEIVLGEPDAQ